MLAVTDSALSASAAPHSQAQIPTLESLRLNLNSASDQTFEWTFEWRGAVAPDKKRGQCLALLNPFCNESAWFREQQFLDRAEVSLDDRKTKLTCDALLDLNEFEINYVACTPCTWQEATAMSESAVP